MKDRKEVCVGSSLRISFVVFISDVLQHAQQMSEWQKRQEQNRSDKLDVIRDGRLEA